MAQKYVVLSLVLGGALLLVGAGCNNAPAAPAAPAEEPAITAPAEQTTTPATNNQDATPMTPTNPPSESKNTSPPVADRPVTANTPTAPAATAPTVKEFTITAKSWEFVPSTITVNKGDKVRLKITSIDVEHGFSLNDFNIRITLNPGTTQTVEFVADKAGTFTFFCSVFCGDGHQGMRGALIVK